MAIFWTSWLVATNMTPFAMTSHNRLQAAERMRETSCLCAKTVPTVSRLVLLSAGLFALHCRSARLQTCCFSLFAFRLFLRLNQKSPFAPREVSRCRLLSLLQSSGSASFTCFVSLLSVLLRLSCALVRRHFVSFSASERSVFYFTPFLPDSELVRFAGAVLTTKMVSVHVHFTSSRYFVAFVCVFCVMLCFCSL